MDQSYCQTLMVSKEDYKKIFFISRNIPPSVLTVVKNQRVELNYQREDLPLLRKLERNLILNSISYTLLTYGTTFTPPRVKYFNGSSQTSIEKFCSLFTEKNDIEQLIPISALEKVLNNSNETSLRHYLQQITASFML